MKISPNWPYEDQNKYWAASCLSKMEKQVAEKELQRRTSLYYFCFLPPSWGVPRRFCLSKLTGKSASDLPRPVCALKDKRTLTVGGGKKYVVAPSWGPKDTAICTMAQEGAT